MLLDVVGHRCMLLETVVWGAVGRRWMLLDVVGHHCMLMGAVGHRCKYVVGHCMLFYVVKHRCMLLDGHRCMLLDTVVLLDTVECCWMLLGTVG